MLCSFRLRHHPSGTSEVADAKAVKATIRVHEASYGEIDDWEVSGVCFQ